MAQDRTIQCADCGTDFIFSASEQEFFASKGFTNEPKRCPTCRQTRKQTRGGAGMGGVRQMFPAVCASCNQETEVPFEPRNGRPVYCSDCFAKSKTE
ncbi:MAG: zinc-ribbon domain containing protein [Dehalogenimonas sp.]|jgi:CxxC-x17-CxxC domain-containing protein|uniref:Zinc-ribbon domain containing protein n=1 Tax=Candidatus Dehalogenimonas loeffleri TaxID=3127115 RepID=A0ABZ2J5H5_9CHLR|nr:zinc-ribbon domain containing protein [Dehalogenimonas sp.]